MLAPNGHGLRAHLIRGATGSFVLQVGFAGLVFLNTLGLARVLGTEGYGAFANAMAWISLLTVPATFGFGILLVRDVAIYQSQQKWALLKGLLRFAHPFVLALSFLVALIAALVAGVLFAAPENANLRLTIWISLPLVPLFALNNLQESATRGLEYVIRARIPGMLIRPGLLLAGIVAIYCLYPNRFSAETAMMVNVAAGVLALFAGVFWLKRSLPPEFRRTASEYTPRLWLRAAFPMLIYGGMQIVLVQTDIVVLGAMRGAGEVGLYAAANRLAYLLMYITVSMELIMAPVMSRLYANAEKERLQRILTRTVRIAFFTTLPFGLLFVFAGKEILAIFGHDFKAAQTVLSILALGRLVVVSVGSGALLLSMTGHERTVSLVFAAGSVVNVILNLLLISRYGMQGAAVASMMCLMAVNCTLSIYAKKITGLNITAFQHSKTFRSFYSS